MCKVEVRVGNSSSLSGARILARISNPGWGLRRRTNVATCRAYTVYMTYLSAYGVQWGHILRVTCNVTRILIHININEKLQAGAVKVTSFCQFLEHFTIHLRKVLYEYYVSHKYVNVMILKLITKQELYL